MYIKELTFKITNTDLLFYKNLIYFLYFFQLKKDSNGIKQSLRKLSKKRIKKRLMESLIYNENINTKDEQANIMKSCEEAMDIAKQYKHIIKTKKKNI